MTKLSVGLWDRFFGKRTAIEVPSASGGTVRREVTEKWLSKMDAAGQISSADPTIRANRLVNSIEKRVVESFKDLINSDPNFGWASDHIDFWHFCLTAASTGLATVHEKVPGIVDAIDQILRRTNPLLRNAVADFARATFKRGEIIPRDEIPTQVGLWVLVHIKEEAALPSDFDEVKAGGKIGSLCIRISASWDIEREPSLLILRLSSAAIKNQLPLVHSHPELDNIELDTWEFLFTIAALTAITMEPGGDELLTDALGKELRAFHASGIEALGDCTAFVGRSLSGVRDSNTSRDAALAFSLGTWVLWNGFGRQPTNGEHELAMAVGDLALTAALQV